MGRRLFVWFALAGSALVLASSAKADLIFNGNVGGGSGICCFEVDLSQVSSTEVLVTVTLDGGATYFIDSGSGNHPGFGFNIIGDPTTITIANLDSPWVSADAHVASTGTSGGFGTFDYYIDNPGPGGSQHNGVPLSFDVTDASGLSVNNFVSNGTNYFVADIGIGSNTGLAGDSVCTSGCGGGGGGGGGDPVAPEPASMLLSMSGLGLISGFVKYRKTIRP